MEPFKITVGDPAPVKAVGHGAHVNPICYSLDRCYRNGKSNHSNQNLIRQMYKPMTPIGQSDGERQTRAYAHAKPTRPIEARGLSSRDHLWECLTWNAHHAGASFLAAPTTEARYKRRVWHGILDQMWMLINKVKSN